ncbi:MAG: hypothetical protein ACFCUE_15040 [Candidatus Bathyarchaeia archaeon]
MNSRVNFPQANVNVAVAFKAVHIFKKTSVNFKTKKNKFFAFNNSFQGSGIMARSRDSDGRIRQYRTDARIGSVAPDVQKHFGYRQDKTVGSVLKENDVTSISALRRKIKK